MSSKKSFREAYGVLQRHAETLRNQREPNIDDLLKIVTESVEAYKVCKTRIEAVEAALEQALSGTGPVGGNPVPTTTRPAAASGSDAAPADEGDGGDDDVPF
jgi:exodeoxyribonuclease VII small subunit